MSLFFLFKRAVGIFVQPLTIVFVLGGLALALFVFRRGKAAFGLLLLAWTVLFFASFPPVTRWAASQLEGRYQPFFPAAAPEYKPEAVVVLGNGVAHPGDPRMPALARLNATALARLAEGVRLAHYFPEATLIVTGNGLGFENCADAMGEAAIELGIPPERIVRFPQSMDTGHEARLVREHMGVSPVILVTTATHMPRAAMYFQDNGVNATPAPCDYIGAVSPDVRSMVNARYFRPKGVNLTDSEEIWHEWLGLAYYAWFGRERDGKEGHE